MPRSKIEERRCYLCGLVKPLSEFYQWGGRYRSTSSRCKKCANSAPRKRDPIKLKARYELRKAVASGVIFKPTLCQRCGLPGEIHGHHADYSRPLEVEWLCKPCHVKEHESDRWGGLESLPCALFHMRR